MGESTNISWCDHTCNVWWGCSPVAAGCDNCYAAAMDRRTGGNYWSPRVKPRLTKSWAKQAAKWNRRAAEEKVRRRVFCGSMMDWCDKDAPEGALDDLWRVIRETPDLDWLLLTKRATLIRKRLPDDWGDGYPNVWLGVTVENKKDGFPRLEAFRDVPAKLKFISAEPLLENVDGIDLTDIDWVIIGGESGPKSRPMVTWWALNLIFECQTMNGIPVWFKQMGGTGRDKGGDIIDGRRIKFYPSGVSPLPLPVTKS